MQQSLSVTLAEPAAVMSRIVCRGPGLGGGGGGVIIMMAQQQQDHNAPATNFHGAMLVNWYIGTLSQPNIDSSSLTQTDI